MVLLRQRRGELQLPGHGNDAGFEPAPSGWFPIPLSPSCARASCTLSFPSAGAVGCEHFAQPWRSPAYHSSNHKDPRRAPEFLGTFAMSGEPKTARRGCNNSIVKKVSTTQTRSVSMTDREIKKRITELGQFDEKLLAFCKECRTSFTANTNDSKFDPVEAYVSEKNRAKMDKTLAKLSQEKDNLKTVIQELMSEKEAQLSLCDRDRRTGMAMFAQTHHVGTKESLAPC